MTKNERKLITTLLERLMFDLRNKRYKLCEVSLKNIIDLVQRDNTNEKA